MKKRYIVTGILSVVSVIAFIFMMSSLNGDSSSDLSQRVTRELYYFLGGGNSDDYKIEVMNGLLRKVAHLLMYFTLAITLFLFIYYMTGRIRWGIIVSGIVSIIIATGDEMYQVGIAGRSGQLVDVFIDGVGTVAGLTLVATVTVIVRRVMSR